MSSIKIQRTLYKVKVSLAPEESEVITKQYTTAIQYRPDQLDIDFVEHEHGGMQFADALIVGNRVLKDGGQGLTVSENIYGENSLARFPEFIRNQVRLASIYVLETVYGR